MLKHQKTAYSIDDAIVYINSHDFFPRIKNDLNIKKIVLFIVFKTQIVYLKNTKHPQGLSSAAYIKYRAGHLYFRFEVHTTEWGRTILCVCGDFSALVTTEVYIHHMFDHWRIHMRNLL